MAVWWGTRLVQRSSAAGGSRAWRPNVIAELVAELVPLWHERHQAGLASRPRKRAVGAGAKHRLVFVDRLLATLAHLRHATTHDELACWFGMDRSTITRAIGEVWPLLAARGCIVSPVCGCGPWPRSSTTSVPTGRPGSSTAPRYILRRHGKAPQLPRKAVGLPDLAQE